MSIWSDPVFFLGRSSSSSLLLQESLLSDAVSSRKLTTITIHSVVNVNYTTMGAASILIMSLCSLYCAFTELEEKN